VDAVAAAAGLLAGRPLTTVGQEAAKRHWWLAVAQTAAAVAAGLAFPAAAAAADVDAEERCADVAVVVAAAAAAAVAGGYDPMDASAGVVVGEGVVSALPSSVEALAVPVAVVASLQRALWGPWAVPLGIGDVVAQKISCQGVFQVAKVA